MSLSYIVYISRCTFYIGPAKKSSNARWVGVRKKNKDLKKKGKGNNLTEVGKVTNKKKRKIKGVFINFVIFFLYKSIYFLFFHFFFI